MLPAGSSPGYVLAARAPGLQQCWERSPWSVVFPVACSLSLAQPPTWSWVRPHLRQGGQVLLGRPVELTPA